MFKILMLMEVFNKIQKRLICSDKIYLQIIGAAIQWRPRAFLLFILLVIPISIGISFILLPLKLTPCIFFICLNFIVWITFKICYNLNDVFSLRKNEIGITWSNISILLILCVWLICFLIIFNIQNNEKAALAIGVIGSLLTLVFQDKIKGAITFVHLRSNNLLNIGDRISIPKHNVNGVVKRFSLTTITIYNLDTTTTIFPINLLQSEHFTNLQKMVEGKTYGRRMVKAFILDTSMFRSLTHKEINEIKWSIENFSENDALTKKEKMYRYLDTSEIEDGMSNAKLFRLYIFHWLMDNKYISQHPLLLVHWKEHIEEGMPLEICAFLTCSNTAAFEWQQSNIIEHILESMKWFGLSLYQRPSAQDVSTKNIYISHKSLNESIEFDDEIL